jgi:hypothetical protein
MPAIYQRGAEKWLLIIKNALNAGLRIRLKLYMACQVLFQEAQAGKVKLGGCCIIEGSPEYYCKDCNNEWNREQALDIAYGQSKGLKHQWVVTSVVIIV